MAHAPQRENLDRGLVAVSTPDGIFLSWRLLPQEVRGATKAALIAADFRVLRNDLPIARVNDSANYLDREGTPQDCYSVAAIYPDREEAPCPPVAPWANGFLDIPLEPPADGVTPTGEKYTYTANDVSVGDVDGDGRYELFVKWDPSNSRDVSQKGYTGRCFIDCIRLDGTRLWRLDMGQNIRAGAHYTQFMVYDFDGDGHAELAVKTAPGTRMLFPDGRTAYITLPDEGASHLDDYTCSAEDYRRHLIALFRAWQDQPEVRQGQWPCTLEACFDIEQRYSYPLSEANAEALTDYFLDVYAPSRSEKNDLRHFEGFVYEGPEYLTLFSGEGRELHTIPFPFPREDDGLRWGDYAWLRIEPCNRVDRFLAGVAYLDGFRPSLIVARGYYTRACVAAYDVSEGRLTERWRADSGFVPMKNPFRQSPDDAVDGISPTHGRLAGQGNHALAAFDVDGDGCMEIVYGAATLDQDGSLLYSSVAPMPDGRLVKLGHGDALQVGRIDPDYPGAQIFSTFEGGAAVPYGWALRDAATGKVLLGGKAERDIGRCMIGDITEDPGLEMWCDGVYTCRGKRLDVPAPSTNARIFWAGDLSTQFTDTADYLAGTPKRGQISDLRHGIMLNPTGTRTNNGTKGNPCLIADILGDFREEILLRTEDSRALRLYLSTDLTHHQLYTLMADPAYRCAIAWQNDCYNQPGYPSFYYGMDMDFREAWKALHPDEDGAEGLPLS